MKSLELRKPHLIIVVGTPASGKSFFAKKFAETFRAPYVDTSIFDTARLHNPFNLTEHLLTEFMKTRTTIICELHIGSRTNQRSLLALAKNNDYEPLFVWVQTDPATAEYRASKLIKSKGTKGSTDKDFTARTKSFDSPSDKKHLVVISGKHTYATQAKTVLKRLSQHANPRDISDSSRPARKAPRSISISS